MDEKVMPDYDINNREHKFIWDVLAHKLTKEDFEAIQESLIEREDDHAEIDKSTRMLIPFGHEGSGMRQPRPLPQFMKDEAHRYVDWSCAYDIWMILSKYCDFYSKSR